MFIVMNVAVLEMEPVEFGRSKEMDFPEEPPEGMQPCRHYGWPWTLYTLYTMQSGLENSGKGPHGTQELCG